MKVAIVHEWLVNYAGSERVVEQMLNVFPDADLFSLVDFLPENQRGFIMHKNVHTSFIQKLPFARTKYRSYLPLMPKAIESLDMRGYDLVISSNHCVAKGVITSPNQKHICMIYTPVRYAWDLEEQYLQESGLDKGLKGFAARGILSYIRNWDRHTAKNVDEYISISKYIQERVKRHYNRDSVVIYPPVDVDKFTLCEGKEDFYLTASRMVPYKKMDLIVEAFTAMPNKKLVVIGEGPDFAKIKAKAGKNVTLMGYQPFEVLKDKMQKAKAFVFAAEEDFGITPVEAQACGTPVIAFGKGGALETVIVAQTGEFFTEQTIQSLQGAVQQFEDNICKYTPKACRANAERFSVERFRKEFKEFVDSKIQEVKS